MKVSMKAATEESDAEVCRRNGWVVGTVLEGDEGYGPERIRLTAIGTASVLAVGPGGREGLWSLQWREWKLVAPTGRTVSGKPRSAKPSPSKDTKETDR